MHFLYVNSYFIYSSFNFSFWLLHFWITNCEFVLKFKQTSCMWWSKWLKTVNFDISRKDIFQATVFKLLFKLTIFLGMSSFFYRFKVEMVMWQSQMMELQSWNKCKCYTQRQEWWVRALSSHTGLPIPFSLTLTVSLQMLLVHLITCYKKHGSSDGVVPRAPCYQTMFLSHPDLQMMWWSQCQEQMMTLSLQCFYCTASNL